MKTRAAVAGKVNEPLIISIEEVELEGPRAGEVLVQIKATGRECSGEEPEARPRFLAAQRELWRRPAAVRVGR